MPSCVRVERRTTARARQLEMMLPCCRARSKNETCGRSGVDCDSRGNGVVAGPRMYQLIRQPDTADDHTFEITFAAPGLDAYVFTFG